MAAMRPKWPGARRREGQRCSAYRARAPTKLAGHFHRIPLGRGAFRRCVRCSTLDDALHRLRAERLLSDENRSRRGHRDFFSSLLNICMPRICSDVVETSLSYARKTCLLMNGPSYVIGSGWWCSSTQESETNPNRKLLGDELTRGVAFFELWRQAIAAYASPMTIVVVDSASPLKPAEPLRHSVNWIELPYNARHSTDHLGQWSGWTRSVLVSGQYALAAEADYFVYVEQDCLIHGKGIIEHCISRMRRGLMFGTGDGTPQPLQQSFFIVDRPTLGRFLANLAALRMRDGELSPEWKFLIASFSPFVHLANVAWPTNKKIRKQILRMAKRRFFDDLPVGSGRVRPIPRDCDYWYFQHGSAEEIASFRREIAHSVTL